MTVGQHPQSNTYVERLNRTLEASMRKYVTPRQTSWCDYIDLLQFAYNTSPHATTHMSPFMMCYGFEPRVPGDQFNPTRDLTGVSAGENTKMVRVTDFLESQQNLLSYARRTIIEETMRIASYHNRGQPTREYSVGDHVLLIADFLVVDNDVAKKFKQRWMGPYKVIGKRSRSTYQLQLPGDMKDVHDWFHISQLRKWVDTDRVSVTDTTGEIESIVGHKRTRGRGGPLHLLVKWVNKPVTQTSYVAEKDWSHSQSLLDSYKVRMKLK